MVRRTIFLACVAQMIVVGCRAPALEGKGPSTLSALGQLPGKEIKEYIPVEAWRQIGELPIERFVAFHATIKSDGSVALTKAFLVYPDHAWDETARIFAKGVALNATSSVGSQLLPRGEVYVIFFKEVAGERPVAIYAYQTDTDPSRGEGNTFSGRRINDEERFKPWARRPQYFRLTVY